MTQGGGEGQRGCVSSHRVTQGFKTLGPCRGSVSLGPGGAGSPRGERRAEVETQPGSPAPARDPSPELPPAWGQPLAPPAECSTKLLWRGSLLVALRLTSPCLGGGTGPGLARQRCREHPWCGVGPALPLCRGGPRGKRLLGVFVGSRDRPWEGPKG